MDSLDEGVRIDAIIIGFFDLVPHNWLLMKLAASDVDSKVVVWVGEFIVGRTQRVTVEGQLSKEVCRKGAFWAHYCFQCA